MRWLAAIEQVQERATYLWDHRRHHLCDEDNSEQPVGRFVRDLDYLVEELMPIAAWKSHIWKWKEIIKAQIKEFRNRVGKRDFWYPFTLRFSLAG